MPVLTIVVPHTLTQRNFEEIQLQLIDKNIRKYNIVNFDFGSVTFLSPFGMMLFVILIEHLVYNLNRTVNISLFNEHTGEDTVKCLAILTRLGFFNSLPNEVNYLSEKPVVDKTLLGSNQNILELTKLVDFDSSLVVVDKAKKAISRNTNYDMYHVSDISIMISEIVQNIFLHSECVRPAFIAIQCFPKSEKVQLAISDCGIGIPETLKKTKFFFNYTADYLLIRQALKAKVSQFQDKENRGEGLMRCREISRKHSAKLLVRSNSGYYFLDFKQKVFGNKSMPFLLGTQVYIDFPIGINSRT